MQQCTCHAAVYLSLLLRSLLSVVAAHYTDPANPYPGESVMAELTPYLETAGLTDPLSKVYDLVWLQYCVYAYVYYRST